MQSTPSLLINSSTDAHSATSLLHAQETTTIAVVGLGYVGLPLALLADKKGYRVIGIDIDPTKVALLEQRVSPFEDGPIAENLLTSNLAATSDFSRLEEASIVVVCVPTPVYSNFSPNLEPLKNACAAIGSFLRKDQLVIVESTVNPGVSEAIVLPILEATSGLREGEDFYIAHCPERINPGDDEWGVENINRVVGSSTREGLEKALSFYRSILASDVMPMGSLKEAEAVKIVENTFRDINIAFVNELARSFSRLEIDIMRVLEGASTKPFAFMPHNPGCGVGGHCIPVDPYYLIEFAKENGFHHDFLSLARRINNDMPKFTADLAIKSLIDIGVPVRKSTIAVLGLSYKPEIGDYRESPSFPIIQHLEEYGVEVISFDPYVPEKSTAPSLGDALDRSNAIVIATAHSLFKNLSPQQLIDNGIEVVVDGRNCLPKDEFLASGIHYTGIGR